ncbi:MAG TPA: hypothetical protein PKC24_12705 [Cyclobacteriaceae bacterium]|nr:hypothetical protein [Cyclobacteriaceae bacterium]
MKISTAYIIPFLVLLIVSAACSSGKKALQRGDYFTAVMTATERLRTNPDHKKSKETLQESYRLAVEWCETSAKDIIASNAPNKYRNALREYDRINVMYEAIRRSPGASKVIRHPVEKYQEVSNLKTMAAEESYEAGIVAMMGSSREDARRAYFLFRDANNFVPGYRESLEMMAQAEFNATLKVVFEENNLSYQSYTLEPTIMSAVSNQFIKFYPKGFAANEAPDFADHLLFITIASMQPGVERVRSEVRTVADSVKTGEREVNGTKVPIKERVEAELTIYTKQMNANGQTRVVIRDARTQATLLSRDVASLFEWSDSWATAKGDQRALNEEQRKLIAKRESRISINDLMRGLQADMDRKVAAELREFYGRF